MNSRLKNAQNTTTFILASVAATLSVVIGIWYIRNPDGFFQDRLGITAAALNMPLAWVFAILIAIGYIMYTAKVPMVRKNLFTFSWLKVLGIWAAVVTGIVEEVVFRQILMDWLAGVDVGVLLQILISAVVFGIAHTAWIFIRGELKIALPVVLSTIALGGLLATLYIVSDRNILLCIVTHMVINLFIEPWLILSAASGTVNDK